MASEFLKYGWIEYQDTKYNNKDVPLKASKTIMFVVTDKGKQIVSDTSKQQAAVNPLTSPSCSSSQISAVPQPPQQVTLLDKIPQEGPIPGEEQTTLREILSQDPDSLMITQSTTTTSEDDTEESNQGETSSRPSSIAIDNNINPQLDPKESNSARLQIILENPKLRSSFKDFLRANFCEENLDFWIDYNTLRRKCRNQSPALPSQKQKDLLEDAYDIWITYLAPGSSCELNVEHSLCQEMARIVNSVVTVIPAYSGQGKPTILITASSASQSLRMMIKLFDRVNDHICRLMASDSVPKFVKTEKYRRIMDAIEKIERKKQKESSELRDDTLSVANGNVETQA